MRLFNRLKYKLIYSTDSLKARCQRFKRGYSYGDIWDMFDWFIRTVKPMLIHLRDHGSGFPIEFENDPNQWYHVLTEMVNCLDMMEEDNVYEHLGFGGRDGYKRMTSEDYKNVYETMEANKNRFFELFSKYFYNLWD